MNEVVVIGYGSQRRENVTGSVANIGGEKLNQVASTNAAQALQGRIAGVQMTQTSSQPGDADTHSRAALPECQQRPPDSARRHTLHG